jgi:hypothetical protein
MNLGDWLPALRKRRGAIGTIAAAGLLFQLLLSVLVVAPAEAASAGADPITAALAASLCAPDQDAQKLPPGTAPLSHHHDCTLCGVGCPMGGCAAAAANLALVLPALRPEARRVALLPPPPAQSHYPLHPSDAVSQAPPRAA